MIRSDSLPVHLAAFHQSLLAAVCGESSVSGGVTLDLYRIHAMADSMPGRQSES